MKSIHDCIDSFKSLKPGWDSYRAVAISTAACNIAHTIVNLCEKRNMPAPSPVPCSDGGVQLEWHCGGIDLEIKARPDRITDFCLWWKREGEDDEDALEELHIPAERLIGLDWMFILLARRLREGRGVTA